MKNDPKLEHAMLDAFLDCGGHPELRPVNQYRNGTGPQVGWACASCDCSCTCGNNLDDLREFKCLRDWPHPKEGTSAINPKSGTNVHNVKVQ